MEEQKKTCEITGTVSGHNGEPLKGARVVVWWQQIRERKHLAAGETLDDGSYRLIFEEPERAPQPLLLVVEALSEYLEKPLFSPLTQAQESLTINLSFVPPDRSEWETLVRSIEPLLSGLKLTELVQDSTYQDISFLATELNKSTEIIMRVAISARLEAAYKIPAPAFYAFLRQQVPASLPSPLLDASHNFTLIGALVQNVASLIFGLTAQVQTQTLTAAIALDIIGTQFTNQIPQIVNELQAQQSVNLLNQPFLVGSATLSQLLNVAGISESKKQTFATALATNTSSMRNFWRTLGDGQHGLTAAEASAIQTTLSVGIFVKNFTPLVQILVQGFSAGTYKTLSDLARLGEQDWVRLITQSGAPANIEPAGTADPLDVFASVVYTRVTRTYPTAALSSRIAGGGFIPAAQQKSLIQFFQNNTDLELIKDNIPVYLAAQGGSAFKGIEQENQAQVVANLRGMQRMLRIAPNVDVSETVLGMGINSATEIAAMGLQQFFLKATASGLTRPEANQVFQAAAQRYAGVVSLFMQLNRGSIGVWPQGLGDISTLDVPMQQGVQTDPTLATLFGSQDYCTAEDCSSILSPAAYLCDLLLWLRNHPQGPGTALDVLNSRRPDIRHLLLNCPNADTELPYIDLVIELLADKVSPPPGTTLTVAITDSQNSITVASDAGFPATNFTVQIGAEILLVTAVAGPGNTTWTVSRAQQGTQGAGASAGASVILTTPVDPPWKQTPDSATTQQLSAAPLYFNQGAFVALFNASYPQSLPYSAGLDELRAYLAQWNLPLWQLRQALLPVTGSTLAQRSGVAAERLGMNVQAENLVVNSNYVPASVAWNIANPATALAYVPAFIQAANITYESLLELLQVTWVQAGLGLTILGLTDTCDTTTQYLTPTTTLAASIDKLQTTITVTDSSQFPAPSFYIGIGSEILQVTAQAGNSWTVVRSQMGSAASVAPAGSTVSVPLDSGFLDRAHRFLRLWLATGYKIWELDLLLNAPSVGNGSLDQNALVNFQAFWQLQQATGLSVDEQLTFYQNIDISSHRDPDGTATTPLYSQVFLNPTTTWLASDPDLVSLSTGGTIGDPVLSDHAKAIQPALAMSASDLALAMALTNNQLTLQSLSFLYAVHQLAATTEFSLSNLLTFAGLLNPAAAVPATTLAAAIDNVQNSITVASATAFGPPNFYVKIGAEILLVTSMSGTGNSTWTVARGQLNSTAVVAAVGVPVTSDAASPAPSLAAMLASPTATLAVLSQATAVQQQSGLSLDAITYILTPPSAITGGWPTTSQMTPANVAQTLQAVQSAVLTLLSASTTLVTGIGAADTSITVASDASFPAPNFYVYIGAEILLVTAVSGSGNSSWTVVRGQQGTTAAIAPAGAKVSPTAGDLNGAVIAAVASEAHTEASSGLATDVTSVILQTLELPPGSGQTLLSVLMDPSLPQATGTITIGGTPAAGDALTAVLTNGVAPPVNVAYALTAADAGSVNQTASDFANAINISAAVTGPLAFLSKCTVAGAVITLQPLTPGGTGSSVTATNAATPGGAGHVSVSPASAQTIGLPAFQNQFLAIQLFDKVALLVRGLRLVAKDLTSLLQISGNASVGGLDLTLLPVTTAQAAQSLSPLLTTFLLVQLARLWTAAPASSSVQTLYDLIGGVADGSIPDVSATQAALAAITGWPLADIESFAAALGLTFPSSYQAPSTYDALRKLEAMSAAVNASGPVVSGSGTTLAAAIDGIQTTITVTSAVGFPAPNFYINIGTEILLVTAFSGAGNTTWTVVRAQLGTSGAIAPVNASVTQTYGAQIVSWGSGPPDELTAESLAASALGILKAQQATPDAWLSLAPTIMNPLRQNQSAALQSYLVAQRDASGNLVYTDTNGLFDYFLIDTQMTSCQVTSRIVQAYIAVQIFVERCLMNLEAPAVVVNLNSDDTWNQWEYMSRYRIWQANREVFLYPENWLIESERPNRTEIYQSFEQEVRQGESTADYLETVVLNYVDRLDGLAHLLVTGTCQDPSTGNIYVVARTLADPPIFYLRSYSNGAWSGWTQIQLDIKASQVVPTVYRGRVCLFWLDVKISNEPQQNLPSTQASNSAPSQDVERYVTLGVNFSIFRNGNWAPAQSSKGKLFDKPLLNPKKPSDIKTVEALYTIKLQAPAPSPGYGTNIWVDIFRFGDYNAIIVSQAEIFEQIAATFSQLATQVSGAKATTATNAAAENIQLAEEFEQAAMTSQAVHVGRAVFDGRFSDLELNNLTIAIYGSLQSLYSYAQATYGPDAEPLLQLTASDPDLTGDPGLLPKAGALTAYPSDGATSPFVLGFTAISPLEQNVGPLLTSASVPLRVVGPDSDLNFDPASYFFFQDNRRCYFVESETDYWTGSTWSPVIPSDPSTVAYQVKYNFHAFYHPFTRLFWNQLAGGGFDLLYDPNLQQVPDDVDPAYSDVLSFENSYHPTWRVNWDHASAGTSLAANISAGQTIITVTDNIWVPSPAFYIFIGSEILQVTGASGTNNTTWTVLRGQGGSVPAAAAAGTLVIPDFTSQDRQFLDFSANAAFSVYNWELFYHIPLFVAQLLKQNQQFEDAQKWFKYIFDPTRQSNDPIPQRFWIPKPLRNLTSAQIIAQKINNLLVAVNQGNPTDVAEIETWRNNPFNPFALADQRPVAYMKSTVMSYLDNLIAWGDNLFSTESREALSEATLLYVIADEILGPTPSPVPPPPRADESFDQLEPSLDKFANAMVNIENVIGGTGSSGGGSTSGAGSGIPPAQTFYFKIPPNPTLLNYWSTVADRLFKLRNCQNIAGAPLQLALFDAPIDPGLLIAAQEAGVDLSSVLSDIQAAPPNYRFTSLYPQALDFVNAVRAYGSSFQAALEKTDAGALALLQQTTQQQLLQDGGQILDWQVQQAQDNIDAATQTLALAQQKYTFNKTQTFMNAGEGVEVALGALFVANYLIAALAEGIGAVAALIPEFSFGAAGFGGSPTALVKLGGKDYHASATSGANVGKAVASALDKTATLAGKLGSYERRSDSWAEAADEANIQIIQANAQLDSANLALQIAQQNQTLHQEQIDNIQKQVDFLNNKFTSDSLYNWMIGSLATTYFQSYQLAYQMCKQVERCYQFELGVKSSSFIQFGYWDSLYKGLLAGESLNQDLRRLQAAYLQQNSRRFEISRYVSLEFVNPAALQQLILTGACDFTLPESLFDNDYPGHYNRRLTRMSITVVYPNPGKFDNVKATLTMVANQVRVSTDITSATYPENPVGSDPRFRYNYAAVPQKIALGNAQDDPGLFLTSISNNLSDQRYSPFENAGAVSSWHLEMLQANNEIDLSTVGDVVLHLYYTALEGGSALKAAAQANNAANLPTSGLKLFSAQNDFVAPPASGANAKPVAPWQGFLYPPTAGGNQVLTLQIMASKFPAWTRGKTITVTSVTVLAIAWTPGNFVLVPQVPLPTASLPMTPVAGATEPNIVSTTIANPGTIPATWSFELQQQGAANFTSLTPDSIGDILLLINYQVS